MPTVTIQRASIKDLDELYAIEIECFENEAFSKEEIRQSMESPDFINLVAISNGQPIGFIIGRIESFKDEIRGHVYTIDVKSEYRRKGIGSMLLEAAERFFIKNNVGSCHLEMKVDNLAAHHLYSKHGYEISGKLKNYYGLGSDGMRLTKTLTNDSWK